MEEKEITIAAAELFLKYGIKSITMDELSRQLGISKKTIYRYFKDKNELVEKTLFGFISQKQATIDEIIYKDKNAVEGLFSLYNYANNIIREYNPAMEFDLQKYFPKIYRSIREMHRTQIYDAILENLVKGKKEGLYRKDIDVSIIAKLFVMRVENIMHHDMVTTEELHSKKFFKEVFKYHLYGVLSAEGLEIVKSKYPEFIKK